MPSGARRGVSYQPSGEFVHDPVVQRRDVGDPVADGRLVTPQPEEPPDDGRRVAEREGTRRSPDRPLVDLVDLVLRERCPRRVDLGHVNWGHLVVEPETGPAATGERDRERGRLIAAAGELSTGRANGLSQRRPNAVDLVRARSVAEAKSAVGTARSERATLNVKVARFAPG